MDENSIEKNLLLASEKQDYFEVVTILNVIRGIQDFDIAGAICDAVFLNTVFSDAKGREKSLGVLNVLMDVVGSKISLRSIQCAYRFYVTCNCKLGAFILSQYYDCEILAKATDVLSTDNLKFFPLGGVDALGV